MNKNIIALGSALMIAASISSCDDYLDTKVDNTFGDDVTWELPDYAQGMLYNGYSNISLLNSFGSNFLDAATDNACTNSRGSEIYDYAHGSFVAKTNFLDNWELSYKCFQYINLFIERGLGENITYSVSDPAEDAAIRKRSEGEAYFLRAWWGVNLLTRFGGVSQSGEALGYPIVLESISEDEKERFNNLPRDTFERCVEQCAADLDKAYTLLPLEYVDTNDAVALQSKQAGRATQRAVLALKSRLMILAASPAYQPDNISDAELNAKWVRAAEAAYAAIAIVPSSGTYKATFNSAYVGANLQFNENEEFLFRKWFNSNAPEVQNFPPEFFGTANTCPSQNLVDAFPTTSGYPITDRRSEYDPQNPFANRDARLDKTIYHNNYIFNSTRLLEIFAYESTGEPARDYKGAHYLNTRTGYYLRKGLSSKSKMLYDKDNISAKATDYHHQPLLRRAELYYNLAEALNRAVGAEATLPTTGSYTAVSIMNQIRTANGIAATDPYLYEVARQGSADDFHALIINERRLEFAFENIRLWDLRRNKMALNEDIYGVETYKMADGSYKYVGTSQADRVLVEDRSSILDRCLYSPIPESECVKNPNMVQNRGW